MSLLKPAPCKPSEHCYHPNGKAQMSLPPRFGKVCCYCGDEVYEPLPVQKQGEHGNFWKG